MADINWSGHRATAAANNGAPQLPPGEGYVGEITDAGAKPTKNGTPQLFWFVKVLVGPYAGKTEKMTQTFNPENPNALSAFYGVTERLGVNWDVVPDGTPAEAVAKLVIGNKVNFDFEHRVDKSTGRVYADFKRVSVLDGSTPNAAPPVVAPPVAAATAVVAAAPAAVVAEALASPTIEEQIAALQAQQAAVAAPTTIEQAEGIPALPAKGKLPF